VAADTVFNRKIIEAGKGIPNQFVYAIGSLVLWTNKPSLKDKHLFNLLKENQGTKITLPNPVTAPYGFQAKLVLENAGLWEQLSPHIVIAENIAQATQYVFSGICEMGFTAKSVLYAPELQGKGTWEEVPASLYEPIYQGFIITKWGRQDNQKATTLFSNFMRTDEVKNILLKNGYTLP
jgi:molybdate transport system substrate-binding protein